MAKNPLNIISVMTPEDNFSVHPPRAPPRSARLKEMQAKFERLWLMDPEQFNPLRNCMEQERLERTWQLLTRHTDLTDQHVADIGCATGVFSRRLRDAGAQVDAIDIAENALKSLKKEDVHKIYPKQEAMPITSLPDHHYDLIVCTELIAHLDHEDYRLFFAELSRLVQPDGYLICSSAIDIDSEDGVEKFVALAQTEFDLMDATPSYHALYLRIKRLFAAPSRFIEGWENSEFKWNEMTHRQGISRWWFWLNSSPLFVWFWYAIHPFISPIRHLLKTNRSLLLSLEKVCRFLWDQRGISHYLFIAKRRPLKMIDPKDIPPEKPKRQKVWD